jgi:molecular chaperone GrpE
MTAPREEELEPRAAEENAEQVPDEAAEPSAQDSPEEDTVEESAAAAEDDETAPELSAEDVLRAERDQFEGKWLRVVAELDNYRKRARREVVETRRFAQADLLRSLLEVQDNFERALQSAADGEDTETNDGFREGVELIFQKFRGLLKDKGVEPMEAMGAEFDPNFHEAVGQLEREGVAPGQVIEVVQQGFHFGDMVLRPARVIISS